MWKICREDVSVIGWIPLLFPMNLEVWTWRQLMKSLLPKYLPRKLTNIELIPNINWTWHCITRYLPVIISVLPGNVLFTNQRKCVPSLLHWGPNEVYEVIPHGEYYCYFECYTATNVIKEKDIITLRVNPNFLVFPMSI